MNLRALLLGIIALFTTLAAAISVAAISVDELVADSNTIIIDVRTPQEYQEGYIAGAINIPVNDLPHSLSQVPSNRPVVVYCRSGRRSAAAQLFLQSNGYSNVYDGGGIDDMRAVMPK